MLQAVFTDNLNIIQVSGLKQWDFGREMEIHLSDLPGTFEAHFSYKGCPDAFVVEATSAGGVSTVPIPNILTTQKNGAVCWLYYKDENKGKTVKTILLPIKQRAKPTDYVYKETEVISYTSLLRRIEELEKGGTSDDVIATAVAEWLENNPIEIPVQSVNKKTGHVMLSASDVGALPDSTKTLPNPNKLRFTGGVEAEYDGSGAVTVTIPTGDGESKMARIENAFTDTEVTIEPNKLYVFPEMASLTIALGEITDASVVNEYHFVFQSGATATTLSISDTIHVPDGFAVDASKIYEISIMENNLCAQSWAVS